MDGIDIGAVILFPCKVDGTPKTLRGKLPIVVVPEFGSKDDKLALDKVLFLCVSDNEMHL